jgi:hypothetical protein
MANPTEIFLQPSNFENIDSSVLEWVNEEMNISVTTNTGFRKVPVVWGSSERSFLSKELKDFRDSEGTIKLPLIAIDRGNTSKDLAKKPLGVNLFSPFKDGKGGVMPIARQIQQEKTSEFKNNDSRRRQGSLTNSSGNGQINFKYAKNINTDKAVYETLYVPYPTYLNIDYNIEVKTEYLEQLNEIVTPFITKLGGINSFFLSRNGHKYEAFFDAAFTPENNIRSLDAQERVFTTKMKLVVLGYIYGAGTNEDRPRVVTRESAIKFVMGKESTIFLDEQFK